MARILQFSTIDMKSVVRRAPTHRVAVEIRDDARPRRTRWLLQFEIQDAAGFRALKGFTDVAVARGDRHRFKIVGARRLRQFEARTADLVDAGKVVIWVDGQRVRPRIKRAA